MNSLPVPTKLGKEPLIDAIFETRFESSMPASSLLPGILLSKTKINASFEAMPASQLPQQMRDEDPNLRHIPLMRMTWGENFAIYFGDRSVSVSCKMPYSGWKIFKPTILEVLSVLENSDFITKIERHSLKYVDYFKNEPYDEKGLDRLNVKLVIGSIEINKQPTHIRTEITEGPFVHAITILSPATVQTEQELKSEGAVVDVDTHRIQEFADVRDFVLKLPELLEEIHTANKNCFFGLLSKSGLEELEPIYEKFSS